MHKNNNNITLLTPCFFDIMSVLTYIGFPLNVVKKPRVRCDPVRISSFNLAKNCSPKFWLFSGSMKDAAIWCKELPSVNLKKLSVMTFDFKLLPSWPRNARHGKTTVEIFWKKTLFIWEGIECYELMRWELARSRLRKSDLKAVCNKNVAVRRRGVN